ncbi:MAG: hypothetical protein ACLQDC_01210, partial [Verrucomicrobiia bacterium]
LLRRRGGKSFPNPEQSDVAAQRDANLIPLHSNPSVLKCNAKGGQHQGAMCSVRILLGDADYSSSIAVS